MKLYSFQSKSYTYNMSSHFHVMKPNNLLKIMAPMQQCVLSKLFLKVSRMMDLLACDTMLSLRSSHLGRNTMLGFGYIQPLPRSTALRQGYRHFPTSNVHLSYQIKVGSSSTTFLVC